MSASSSARFFAVPARFSGRVVVRLHRSGSAWAWRAPGAGQSPAPACLFVPFRSPNSAARLARAAASLGWSAWVRPGPACAIYRAGPLAAAAPDFACKVVLPPGVTAAAARSSLHSAWDAV